MRILVALDQTPASLHAARTASMLFAAAEPEFLVVNVARTPVPWTAAGPGFGTVFPLQPDVLGFASDPDHRDEIGDAAQLAGIADPEVEVVVGEPAREICEAAERHDVDVIVVGAHDKSFLERIIDPSVSHGVVRGTTRPVLVVSDVRES